MKTKKTTFLNDNKGVFSGITANGETVTYRYKRGLNNKWILQNIKFENKLVFPCVITGNSSSCDLAADFAIAAALSCAIGDYLSCGIYAGLAVHYGIKCRNGDRAEDSPEAGNIEPRNKIIFKNPFILPKPRAMNFESE